MDDPTKTGNTVALTYDSIIDQCIVAPDAAAKALIDALDRIELLETALRRIVESGAYPEAAIAAEALAP